MTYNDAVKIMAVRAPVVTTGKAKWKIGDIEYQRISAVILRVGATGRKITSVECRDKSASHSVTILGLDDIELSPNTPQTLIDLMNRISKRNT